MAEPDDMCYSCDHCGEETDAPISIHAPVGGGNRSPLDFCPSCAADHMQRMADRLGSEHGSKMVLEVKSRAAKRGPAGIAPKARSPEESDEE